MFTWIARRKFFCERSENISLEVKKKIIILQVLEKTSSNSSSGHVEIGFLMTKQKSFLSNSEKK